MTQNMLVRSEENIMSSNNYGTIAYKWLNTGRLNKTAANIPWGKLTLGKTCEYLPIHF